MIYKIKTDNAFVIELVENFLPKDCSTEVEKVEEMPQHLDFDIKDLFDGKVSAEEPKTDYEILQSDKIKQAAKVAKRENVINIAIKIFDYLNIKNVDEVDNIIESITQCLQTKIRKSNNKPYALTSTLHSLIFLFNKCIRIRKHNNNLYICSFCGKIYESKRNSKNCPNCQYLINQKRYESRMQNKQLKKKAMLDKYITENNIPISLLKEYAENDFAHTNN